MISIIPGETPILDFEEDPRKKAPNSEPKPRPGFEIVYVPGDDGKMYPMERPIPNPSAELKIYRDEYLKGSKIPSNIEQKVRPTLSEEERSRRDALQAEQDRAWESARRRKEQNSDPNFPDSKPVGELKITFHENPEKREKTTPPFDDLSSKYESDIFSSTPQKAEAYAAAIDTLTKQRTEENAAIIDEMVTELEKRRKAVEKP